MVPEMDRIVPGCVHCQGFRCGLVSKTVFNIDDLHPALNALLSSDYDPIEWACELEDTLDLILEELTELVPKAPSFFLPEEGPHSLIICVLYLIYHQVLEANLVEQFVKKHSWIICSRRTT
jgi:hypothetical protein